MLRIVQNKQQVLGWRVKHSRRGPKMSDIKNPPFFRKDLVEPPRSLGFFFWIVVDALRSPTYPVAGGVREARSSLASLYQGRAANSNAWPFAAHQLQP